MGGLLAPLVERAGTAIAKAPFARSVLVSGFEALQRVSPTAGPLLRKMLFETGEKAETLAGPRVNALRGLVEDLPEAHWGAVREFLDKGTPLPAGATHLQGRALQIHSMLEDTYQEFLGRGLSKPGWRQPNYFPHTFPFEMFKGKGEQDAINHLISTGQAKNVFDAKNLLRAIRPGGMRVNNLESPRLVNLPGYRTDKGVLFDHLAHAYRRLAEVDSYGAKDENLRQLLSMVEAEGGNMGFAQKLVEGILRRSVGRGAGLEGLQRSVYETKLSSLQAATKLSFAFISQAGQSLNIGAVTGLSPMIRGLAKMIGDYGKAEEFGLISGATLSTTLHEIRRVGLGEAWWDVGSKVMRWSQFQRLDKLCRVWAANSGRFYAERLFEDLKGGDQVAMRKLRWLGVDVQGALQRGALGPEDILRAGKRVSDSTQFHTSAGNLPRWWLSSPEARTITMYKQFAFQQAKFIKDFVLKPAILQGEFKPLVYMSLIFPTFGELIADAKRMARWGDLKERPDADRYVLDRAVDNLSMVGGFGIFSDAIASLTYGDKSMFWRFIGGPILGDVVDLTYLGASVLKSPHPLDVMKKEGGRELLGRIPFVGPRLRRELYPPKSTRKRGPLERGELTRFVEHLTQ